MIRNYFKITFRNLIKHKTYSLINILGLAIGIASFLIISLYITDELKYDRYHKNARNIYRLVNVYDFEGVGENSASSPFPVAFTLKNDYPDLIKNVVRVFNFQAPRSFVEYQDKKFNERRFFFADSTFFELFDHVFVKGNPKTALNENGSLVITESMAEKYFGNEDPMGKSIRFETNLELHVTGIIKDVPDQSHFKFDFMGSMSSLRSRFRGDLPKTWVWNPCWTYLLLDKNVDPKTLEAKFPEFIEKYFYDAEKTNITLYLQPLLDIHLKSKLDYEIEPNKNIASIYIYSAIAIFLLVIAIINYMNLSTATSAGRAKEIGIKKVTGAHQRQLILQFIGESVIMSFIALILAIILVELIAPFFNDYTDKNISIQTLFEFSNLIQIILLGFLVGVLSGAYPALYLSSFEPVTVLKSKIKLGSGSGLSRKILVVAQFTISITLIIGTVIIHKQLNFLRNADLGFEKKNIIVIPINRTPVANIYPTFKRELLNNSNIVSVTTMDDIFGASHNTHEFRPEGFPDDKWQFYPALVVNYDFVKTFGINILAGRDYHEENKTDPSKGLLINESMVKHLGWESPEKVLGKKLRSLNGDERIIGVFKDFHATSLHDEAGPFILNMKEYPGEVIWFMKYMAIKIHPGTEKNALAYIEKMWNKTAPDRPFEYLLLDQELANLYKDEENLSQLSLIFSLIIIFIAAMGLIGLSSFLAEQKTKEIGIRKVLGATNLNIITTISKEFIWLILLACLFAWIIGYLIMADWLNSFAYQTTINWTIFVLAALFALIVALAITSLRAIMASRANPVVTLKYE
jgi:putative ABC transport system permease protein